MLDNITKQSVYRHLIKTVVLLFVLIAACLFIRWFYYRNSLIGCPPISTTNSKMSSLATALDGFRLDVGRYPSTKEGLAALVNKSILPAQDRNRWRGPYMRHAPSDPWGHEFRYRSPAAKLDFDIYTLGADDKVGGIGENEDIYFFENAI